MKNTCKPIFAAHSELLQDYKRGKTPCGKKKIYPRLQHGRINIIIWGTWRPTSSGKIIHCILLLYVSTKQWNQNEHDVLKKYEKNGKIKFLNNLSEHHWPVTNETHRSWLFIHENPISTSIYCGAIFGLLLREIS